jgi:hypothetical protein
MHMQIEVRTKNSVYRFAKRGEHFVAADSATQRLTDGVPCTLGACTRSQKLAEWFPEGTPRLPLVGEHLVGTRPTGRTLFSTSTVRSIRIRM